jgi:hypothetical protein
MRIIRHEINNTPFLFLNYSGAPAVKTNPAIEQASRVTFDQISAEGSIAPLKNQASLFAQQSRFEFN